MEKDDPDEENPDEENPEEGQKDSRVSLENRTKKWSKTYKVILIENNPCLR